MTSTPFKKSNATRLWSIISLLSWICIHQMRYPWKAYVYLPFDWCLICSDCFTEACVGWVNWGQWQKGRVAKLIGFYGKCVLCLVSCFPFVSACTHTRCARAHSLYQILLNKTSCWISNRDAILEHLFFDIASNIITLRTFLTNNHNK